MKLDHNQRWDVGEPGATTRGVVPASGASPAPKAHGDVVEWPHGHRPYYTEAELDPIARLEWLDDLMFAAIDGDPVALDCAADAWHKTRSELGETAIEESRQQYMRHAQSVWHSLRAEPNHPPHKVFAAIEINSLLAHRPH
jgi:hypothetical protein